MWANLPYYYPQVVQLSILINGIVSLFSETAYAKNDFPNKCICGLIVNNEIKL